MSILASLWHLHPRVVQSGSAKYHKWLNTSITIDMWFCFSVLILSETVQTIQRSASAPQSGMVTKTKN